jgi:hypothetical protein
MDVLGGGGGLPASPMPRPSPAATHQQEESPAHLAAATNKAPDNAYSHDLELWVAGTQLNLFSAASGWPGALVTEASRRMRAAGICVVCLHVNANNPEARASWRRLGWRESGLRGHSNGTRTPSVTGLPEHSASTTGLDAPSPG